MLILRGDFINNSFFETYSISEQSKIEIDELAVKVPVVRTHIIILNWHTLSKDGQNTPETMTRKN